MKEIERYVKEITMNLPDDEKLEIGEEIYGHLQEHVNELIKNGSSKEMAIRMAIESFGNQNKLNRELKRVFFPFYKVIRFLWSVLFVTGFLCLASYSIMEYIHPELENNLPLYSVFMAMFLVFLLAGAGEALYDALISQFKLKSRGLLNPWLFFLVPALLYGGIQTLLLFNNTEKFQNNLSWVDLYTFPIGAVAYIISRQLFTILFLSHKKVNRNTVN